MEILDGENGLSSLLTYVTNYGWRLVCVSDTYRVLKILFCEINFAPMSAYVQTCESMRYDYKLASSSQPRKKSQIRQNMYAQS